MNGEAILERRYRRLLAWYPAGYRRAHEAEILGVLMAAAPEGRRRPGLADSANLIWGALRIRTRPAKDCTPRQAWRDALAVLSVVIPILLVAIVLIRQAVALAYEGAAAIPWLDSGPTFALTAAAARHLLIWQRVAWTLNALGPLALLGAVLARWRALAIALTGSLGVLWVVIYSPLGQFAVVLDVGAVSLLLLEAAALTASSGLRRGLELLSWKHVAWPVAAVALPWVVVGQLLQWLGIGLNTEAAGLAVAAGAVGMLAVIALITKSSWDKRLCILMAVAIYTLITEYTFGTGGFAGPGAGPRALYLTVPTACLPVLVTAALAVRMTLYRSPPVGTPPSSPGSPERTA